MAVSNVSYMDKQKNISWIENVICIANKASGQQIMRLPWSQINETVWFWEAGRRFYALIATISNFPSLTYRHEYCTSTNVQSLLCKRIIINDKFCPCENKRKLRHCNCIAKWAVWKRIKVRIADTNMSSRAKNLKFHDWYLPIASKSNDQKTMKSTRNNTRTYLS